MLGYAPVRQREMAVKIYTGKGDAGQTSIWGGVRVHKDSLRIEALVSRVVSLLLVG